MQARFISTQNLYWEVAAVYCHLLEKRLLRKDVGIRCHHQAVRMLDSCAKAKKTLMNCSTSCYFYKHYTYYY